MKGLSLDFDGGHAEKMIPSTTFVDIADVVCKERLFQGYEMRFRRNHAFGHPEVSFETLMTSCQGVWEDYFGGSELSEEKPPSAHPSRKRRCCCHFIEVVLSCLIRSGLPFLVGKFSLLPGTTMWGGSTVWYFGVVSHSLWKWRTIILLRTSTPLFFFILAIPMGGKQFCGVYSTT